MNIASQLTFPAPLKFREELNIIDSTKLNSYNRCPRNFFYGYVLGWQPSEPSIHLVFGSAWHEAMEHLLKHKKGSRYADESIGPAWDLFMATYREDFPEDMDDVNAPKDPGNALKALVEYTEQYTADDFEVLYLEVPGSVPINDAGDLIHFKMDAIVRDSDGVYCLEHKTTGQDSKSWRAQWTLSTQIGTYVHALYCIPEWDEDDVYGAKVNGAILRKKGNAFVRIPIRKTNEQQRVWLWNTQVAIESLKHNYTALAECKEEDDVLQAFPMNTEGCLKYGLCPYHHLCTASTFNNPLQRAETPPIGFTERHWNPRKKFGAKAKHVFEDGQIKETKNVQSTTDPT